MEDEYRRPKPSKKPKIVLSIAAFIIIAVAAIAFWAGSGNDGQISQPPVKKSTTPAANKIYDGKYMSFSYKGIYDLQRKPAGADLEVAILSANTNFDKQLAVSVSALPDGKLDNNTSFNLRQSSPATYQSRTLVTPGGNAVVFTKADTEQTAFIQRGGQVAVLSFTTTASNMDNLEPEVDALLATFQWKAR